MGELSAQALAEVLAAFERYRIAVLTTPMTDAAKDSYLEYGGAFIRWLRGEFDPRDATGIV